jgi:hypothetical protein
MQNIHVGVKQGRPGMQNSRSSCFDIIIVFIINAYLKINYYYITGFFLPVNNYPDCHYPQY